ncbi:uncharacterized protein B0T15DRAFT_511125 [Chaetomium strumarium]|uniref:Uncharacterized protein n=1 Tax=Chaetomium strumarium TaxID=1170767 RepID=A0AAJ0M191_9PEZI|nr:hypothetical protein B0T15DRAFT_511125 [Chaetomium strumarium]
MNGSSSSVATGGAGNIGVVGSAAAAGVGGGGGGGDDNRGRQSPGLADGYYRAETSNASFAVFNYDYRTPQSLLHAQANLKCESAIMMWEEDTYQRYADSYECRDTKSLALDTIEPPELARCREIQADASAYQSLQSSLQVMGSTWPKCGSKSKPERRDERRDETEKRVQRREFEKARPGDREPGGTTSERAKATGDRNSRPWGAGVRFVHQKPAQGKPVKQRRKVVLALASLRIGGLDVRPQSPVVVPVLGGVQGPERQGGHVLPEEPVRRVVAGGTNQTSAHLGAEDDGPGRTGQRR